MRKCFLRQIARFGIVGVIAFFIDYILLLLLTEVCGFWYLGSAFISCVIALIFNYFASMRYVFTGKEGMSKKKEFTIFIILSIGGIVINEVGMWIAVELCGIFYMLSKILVTCVTMVYNFVTRKVFLDESNEVRT